MGQKREREDALTRQTFETNEIAPERAAEEARADIQSAIIVARKFPRKEDSAYERLLHACERTSFAEEAMYSFPRWSSEEKKNVDITGPSVKLAREAARVWGNMRWGITIIADSEDTRTIEGWAYDLESNNRPSQQDTFTKMGYKKGGGWEPLNERGLREATSRRGAFLIRNMILNLIPSDFIDDAMAAVEKTLAAEVRKDPDAEKKRIILSFSEIGVPAAELEAFLGHDISSVSPAELKRLRGVYKSIDDGNSTWAEYMGKKDPVSEPKKTQSGASPTASTNDRTSSAPSSTQSIQETSILDEKKLSLVHQMLTKKGWMPVQYQEVLSKFGFRSEAQITEAALPNIMNVLVAGPGAAPSNPPVEQSAQPATSSAASAPAESGGNGKSGEKINDAQKGQVWQVARGKRWAKGSGTPNDPLHLFLMDYYKIDSVTKIRVTDLEEIKASLELGPAKYKYQPVE